MREIFEKIYRENGWKSDESVSGHGSTLAQTVTIRQELPRLLKRLDIKSMLDIPCGDFWWMAHIEEIQFIEYIGADIVPDLIRQNKQRYTHPNWRFGELDITRSQLPRVDLVLVRDLLGHFSNRDLQLALNNLKASGSKYLLATTFPDFFNDHDIETGQWRPLNLAYYCGLPQPIELINEHCTERGGEFASKSLGLWKLDDED